MPQTRSQTKREWHRSQLEAAEPYTRLICGWDWLRAVLHDLTQERADGHEVSLRRLELRHTLIAGVTAFMSAQRKTMDDALTLTSREVRRRDRTQAALSVARSDEERMRAEHDWVMSSAKALARPLYTITAETATARRALREQALHATADMFARLAETGEEA
jgi:hypothetical protein